MKSIKKVNKFDSNYFKLCILFIGILILTLIYEIRLIYRTINITQNEYNNEFFTKNIKYGAYIFIIFYILLVFTPLVFITYRICRSKCKFIHLIVYWILLYIVFQYIVKSILKSIMSTIKIDNIIQLSDREAELDFVWFFKTLEIQQVYGENLKSIIFEFIPDNKHVTIVLSSDDKSKFINNNDLTEYPGGTWIFSAKNSYIKENRLYSNLKNTSGTYIFSSITFNKGDAFENDNGYFSKISM